MLIRPGRVGRIGQTKSNLEVVSAYPNLSDGVYGIIGSKLRENWDADDHARMAESGGVLSSWVGSYMGTTLAQATGGIQPSYGATAFSSGKPAVTLDGTDDRMDASIPAHFPVVGTDDVELIVLLEILNDPSSDTTVRPFFSYGGNSSGQYYSLRRGVSSSQNRLVGSTGASSNSISTSPVVSGPTVQRAMFTNLGDGADTISGVVEATTLTAITNATFAAGTTRIRFGNIPNGTTNSLNARFRNLIVTAPLSGGEWSALKTYLDGRK